MRKVLLADDEAVILGGIRRLIDWEKLGFTIVGEAHDGDELDRLRKELRPDLIVTDIKMPGKTGLEVIEEARDDMPDTKFIFISGFEEFSFAKTAIKFGAVDYLLKPVSADDLSASVKKAAALLGDQDTVKAFEVRPDDMQEVFSRVNDGYEFAEKELYERFAEMNISLDSRDFIGATFQVVPEATPSSFEKTELRKFAAYNKLQAEFTDRRDGFVIRKESDALHLILLPEKNDDTLITTRIPEVKQIVEEATGATLSVGLGFRTDDLAKLRETYRAARSACGLSNTEKETTVTGESGTVIAEVKQYIKAHFRENISLKELSEVACVSESYLSALFKKRTGGNYKKYLTMVRMEEAMRLLVSTDLKTYEIADAIGYNTPRQFVDTFKGLYGVSPMDYRKEREKS